MASSELGVQLTDADIEFDEKILRDLNVLVNDLKLGSDDLVNEWLAFQHNNNADRIDQSNFKIFSKHLQSAKVPKKTRSRASSIHNNKSLKPLMEVRSTPNTNTNQFKCNSFSDDPMDKYLSMQTPSKSAKKSSRSSAKKDIARSTPVIPTQNIHQTPIPVKHSYKSRKKRGDTIDILNDHLAKQNNIQSINIQIDRNRSDLSSDSKPYRFMNEQMYLKQDAIKQRILFIGRYLMQQIQNDKNEHDEKETEEVDAEQNITVYSAIDEPSQRQCYYLGRIVNDGDHAYNGSASDKITAGNIMLQDEYGKTIRLDISSLQSVSLFPGQIVAVCGVNSSGKEIHVAKIYQKGCVESAKKENCKQDMNIDADMQQCEDKGVLQLMIACGPFTAQNSLEFDGSPFHDFGKAVAKNKPNVVLLMGPFTDSQNELIKKNEINCSFEELFQHLLRSFLECVGDRTKVIIIPSTKDVHHFSAFPQPKYTMKSTQKLSNVRFIPNPSEFEVNNVSFGVCCADFLWDCCRTGFTKNIKDRLLAIMAHSVDQQNFYPLQPASKSLRMDYNYHTQLYMKKKLDLLIMPSKLKQFAKIYDETKTLCINPSYLTRANSGGSYAVLSIHKSNDYNVTDYSDLIRVDILRI